MVQRFSWRLSAEALSDWQNRLRALEDRTFSAWTWYGGQSITWHDGERLINELPKALVEELIGGYSVEWQPEWLAVQKGFELAYIRVGAFGKAILSDGRCVWWATRASPNLAQRTLQALDKLARVGFDFQFKGTGGFFGILLGWRDKEWEYLDNVVRSGINFLEQIVADTRIGNETELRLAELRTKQQLKTPPNPVAPAIAETQTDSGGLIQRPRSRRRAKDWLGEAIKLLQSNPELSNRKIAKEIGIDPSTLSRDSTFQKAAAAARQPRAVRRGFVANGRLEAVAPENVESE